TIDLPKNIKTIKNGDLGRKVFEPTKIQLPTVNLRQIILRSKKIKTIQKNSFSGLAPDVVIRVPKDRLKKYKKMLYASGMSKDNKVKPIVK
ncbi:MAG: hypothetical protein II915_02350, partial [Eubacterium sp.]|nr:hypothetical protein [Eubacterium sp.]